MHIDLLARLNSFANHGATWVMWLLVALSIVGLGIILERALTLYAARDDLARVRDRLLGVANRRDRQGNVDLDVDLGDGLGDAIGDDFGAALIHAGRSRAFEASVLVAAAYAGGGLAAAEQRMAGALQLARLQMEKGLAFLGTVGTNAPFVGLLGTVIGIIRAFHALDASGGKVNAGLMVEVGEALVATAIGILVALPAIAFFNLFQRVIKTRLARAEALGRELAGALAPAAPSERS